MGRLDVVPIDSLIDLAVVKKKKRRGKRGVIPLRTKGSNRRQIGQ